MKDRQRFVCVCLCVYKVACGLSTKSFELLAKVVTSCECQIQSHEPLLHFQSLSASWAQNQQQTHTWDTAGEPRWLTLISEDNQVHKIWTFGPDSPSYYSSMQNEGETVTGPEQADLLSHKNSGFLFQSVQCHFVMFFLTFC